MRRLQAKVRDYMKIESQLTEKMNLVQSRDENFMNKLENALCFGKMMVMLKPCLQKT
jgi:hypothetical protein